MGGGQVFGSRLLGYLLTISGGLLWAVGGSCGQKIFEDYALTANWLVPVRILIAGFLLLGFSLIRLGPKAVFAVFQNKKDTRDLLLFSALGAGASQLTYYTCIQYSNAAFATVISYMFPAIILLYGIFRSRRLPLLYEVTAVILVTVGAFTCTTHWDISAMEISGPAILFGVLSAIASAYNTVKPQRLLKTYPLLAIMALSMILGGLFMSVICRPWTVPVETDSSLILLMAVIIIGGTIFAFSLFQAGVRIVGSLAGSVLAAIEPVGAVVIAVLFLNVSFTAMDLLGFVLILATVPLIALGQSREEARARIIAAELLPEAEGADTEN